MQKKKAITRAVFIFKMSAISTAMVLILLTGCGRGGQQQDAQLQSARQQQENEEEPEKLKNMEARLESLIELLGGPAVKMDENGSEKQDTQQQDTQQQGTQQQGTKQQGTQQQGTQQQGTQQQGTQQQGTQPQDTKQQSQQNKAGQQPDDKWKEIGMLISNLHYQWNDYMPEIAKRGADMKIIDNFDNGLNSLTTTIEAKNIEKSLTAANSLYAYIPDLYSLYRRKMSPEVKRMIYYTRNIILEAKKDGWEQAVKDDEALEKSWSLFRNTLEKEQKEIGDKLDFSIYELKKVVSETNKQLADIKGRIVLSNIKELQKSFEEKK